MGVLSLAAGEVDSNSFLQDLGRTMDMKILFDSQESAERCNGCGMYGPHFTGKTSDGHPAFKCRGCGRLTLWMGGDVEKVITLGTPPAGV